MNFAEGLSLPHVLLLSQGQAASLSLGRAEGTSAGGRPRRGQRLTASQMTEANPPYRRSFKTPPVLHPPGSVLVQVKERRLSQRSPKASLAKGWASLSLSMLKLSLQGDGRAVSGGGASGGEATRVEPSGVGLVASQTRPRGAPQPVEHSGPGQLPVRAAPARSAAASILSSRPAGRGVRARCLPAAWPGPSSAAPWTSPLPVQTRRWLSGYRL